MAAVLHVTVRRIGIIAGDRKGAAKSRKTAEEKQIRREKFNSVASAFVQWSSETQALSLVLESIGTELTVRSET